MADLVVYGTRAHWGAPDFSPFVAKLETWLRLAGVPYVRRDQGSPLAAPKGKVPYVDFLGQRMGDSQLIIEAVRKHHSVTLDDGFSAAELAKARAVRRMLEEGMYFSTLRLRWMEPDGWALQVPAFKPMMPPVIGGLVLSIIRRRVLAGLHAQGTGRHTREEAMSLALGDLDALELILGENAFLLGESPCSADATIYAFLLAIQGHPLSTPVHERARSASFLAYTARIRARYWAVAPALTGA